MAEERRATGEGRTTWDGMRLSPLAPRTSLLFLILALASLAFSTTIRTRNGDLLSGEITSHDDKGFTLHRHDTGGDVTIAWEQLDADEAKRVQDLLKLPEEKEELMIDGSRLTLDDGTTVEGKITDDRPDLVVIKTLTGNRQVPRARIQKVDPVQIPALAFCTAQELYDQQAKSLDAKDAKAQYAMGQFCIRVKLFDKAKEHFDAALALDPSMGPEIQKRLSVVDRTAKESEAQALKDQANSLLAAQKFDEALAAAKKLASDFGGTAAGRDADALVKKITDDQTAFASDKGKFLGSKVVDEWYNEMDSLLRKAATQKGLTLAQAKTYVEKALTTEIKQKLADSLKLKADDLDAAWRSRQVADAKSASYGEGTWVIDNMRSRGSDPASLDDVQERAKNDTTIAAEQKKLALDMSKAPEDWWAKASTQVKMNWLRAYNAERNLTVVEAKYEACASCKGKGLLGGAALCKRCNGLRADRVVTYK